MRKTLSIIGIFALVGMVCYAQSDTAVEDGIIMRVKVSLSDGSTLLGTPHFTTLTLATDFGKPQIPLALVSTLAFAKEGVKVTFANKDVLSGTLEDSAFKIATSFGDVLLEYAQVRTMTFSQQRTQGGEAGLLLHVPMDRVDANLDVFDARMETKNVRIVDGERGQVMAIEATQSQATIHLPCSPYTMKEGTIEFWARIPNPYQDFPYWGIHFFVVASDGYTENNQFEFVFTANYPRGGGGLSGTMPGLYARSHSGRVSSAAATGLLGNTPDGWHHYAFIWNRDGVDFEGYKGKKLLLAVDGRIVASTDAAAELHDFARDFSKSLDANPRLKIPWDDMSFNKSLANNPFEMSDLKIWNHAKIPVVE